MLPRPANREEGPRVVGRGAVSFPGREPAAAGPVVHEQRRDYAAAPRVRRAAAAAAGLGLGAGKGLVVPEGLHVLLALLPLRLQRERAAA
jgi:hypothetical protein